MKCYTLWVANKILTVPHESSCKPIEGVGIASINLVIPAPFFVLFAILLFYMPVLNSYLRIRHVMVSLITEATGIVGHMSTRHKTGKEKLWKT